MAWFTDRRKNTSRGEKHREHVVLNLACDACFLPAVGADDVDLPIVIRHHLKRDLRSVWRPGWRIDPFGPGADGHRVRRIADTSGHQSIVRAIVRDERDA